MVRGRRRSASGEIIFDVYTMISLNSPAFLSLNQSHLPRDVKESNSVNFANHQQWNSASGWKNTLNNLRLIVQPLLLFWWILPWIDIDPNSYLLLGLNQLISAMNRFKPFYSSG